MLGEVGHVLPYVERANGAESVPGWYASLDPDLPIEARFGFWQTRNTRRVYLGFDLPHAAATIDRLLEHAQECAAAPLSGLELPYA